MSTIALDELEPSTTALKDDRTEIVRVESPSKSQKAASSADAVNPDLPPTRRPFYRRRAFLIFFAIVAILSIAAVIYWLHARQFESTDDANIDGRVIPISPQISALILAVHTNDNQFVHKGDLLIELDPTDYRIALAQAQGMEAAAKGKLEQARAGVPAAESAVSQAKAQLDSAQVNFNNANRDLQRYSELDKRAASRQQVDNATAAQESGRAQVEQAQARLESAQADVASAKANILAAAGDYQKAQADTEKARTNLGYCRVLAPADGRVTGKNVDAGMYVTSASQLFSLVPSEVWVIANFKETQLDLMRPGQPVTIHVDAYPDRDFAGTLQSIQAGTGARYSVIPAENATGNFVKVVQRVPVKITFDANLNDDPAHLLAPGMSIEATVRVRDGSF